MTANRPRRTGPLDDSSLTEVFFTGTFASGTGWLVNRNTRLWRPPTDVYETEDQIVVQVEIAGMRREDFYIDLHERHLAIGGLRRHGHTGPRAYHQIELNFGEFRSEVELPASVERDRVEAEYEAGFLRVTLPKLKPQRIDIA
jgi:HSP20 family protein